MEEPSVLDYLKSLLPGRKKIDLAAPEEAPSESPLPLNALPADAAVKPQDENRRFPWRTAVAVFLALLAQLLLEPGGRDLTSAVFLYLLSAMWLVWAMIKREWQPADLPERQKLEQSAGFFPGALAACLIFLILGFFLFSGNRFTLLNVTIWFLAIAAFLWAFWVPGRNHPIQRLGLYLKKKTWTISISRFGLLILAVVTISLIFRFYRLDSVLGEMFSDHAEKLYDVMDVLDGQYSIFFPRNTGREAFQFYLTAFISQAFGTGISFMSLKLGTVLCGIFTLPFIYLLGKEIGNRWVGITALALSGIAYWPNVISRVGLRFPIYPLFAAPALYFLIRGLRSMNRNDFILAGIFLGIGLHGYSPMRFVPIVLAVIFLVFLVHRQSRGYRQDALMNFILLAFAAFVIFLPLARYWTENPDMFGYRAFSRMTGSERAVEGSVILVFLNNLWKSLLMPFLDNGVIWVHSIPGRPALDVVSAAFYFVGTIGLISRYYKKRSWEDLAVLLSIPLLMMPSILSLAFPEENPSLNRSAAAYIPIFIVAAFGLEGFLRSIMEKFGGKSGKAIAILAGLMLYIISMVQNASLVFTTFDRQFMAGAWNTSEIGKTIRFYADTIGSSETAYVVPYPYWVDTRLVGINAGFPRKDYALWPEDFNTTLDIPAPKLFIVYEKDLESLKKLQNLYPDGITSYHNARLEGKDYFIFLVPPDRSVPISGQP